MREIEITDRASRDLSPAYLWYESRKLGLSSRLADEVNKALTEIQRHPFRYPEMQRGVRRVLLDTFPYKIIYRVLANAIRVLAVYHHARDPEKWNDSDRE